MTVSQHCISALVRVAYATTSSFRPSVKVSQTACLSCSGNAVHNVLHPTPGNDNILLGWLLDCGNILHNCAFREGVYFDQASSFWLRRRACHSSARDGILGSLSSFDIENSFMLVLTGDLASCQQTIRAYYIKSNK